MEDQFTEINGEDFVVEFQDNGDKDYKNEVKTISKFFNKIKLIKERPRNLEKWRRRMIISGWKLQHGEEEYYKRCPKFKDL